MEKTQLRQKAMRLPLSPGVYVMKDKTKKIIYIGKAKALKNRVSQYFGSGKNHDDKVRRMVALVEDFEYIVTDSEFEALVLECSMIKQHAPKYNILLKDDKGYNYIRVTAGPWSKIQEARKIEKDGARYLGPYTSSWTVKNTVDEVRKIFKLPSCNKNFPRDIKKGRACLNHFMGYCNAPCVGKISQSDYEEAVKDALSFLQGGSSAALSDLARRMEAAAENLEFEQAAKLRDRIKCIQKFGEKQKIVESKIKEQDVIALSQGGGTACFEVFRFSDRRLYDRENFLMGEVGDPQAARREFIEQYYVMRMSVPPRVMLDGEVEDEELLCRWLSEKAGKKVRITRAQIGDQARLVEMVRKNAAERVAQDLGRSGREVAALDELGRLLGLPAPPEYIEAYDISNFAGANNVAGMVVFDQGKPLKSAYKKFKIKSLDGQDDYGSMKEVITRRLAEYETHKESGEGFGRLPDLILLDGGKGHVSTIRPVIQAFGLDIPVFGMVKDDKHRTRAIAENGGEIAIQAQRQVFTLVSKIQDEVHRFAIGYQKTTHKKNTLGSSMLAVPGIGDTRIKALLRQFKTMTALKNATVEELLTAKGMNRPAAERLYRWFREENA